MNIETIIFKYIACNVVVAGTEEDDTGLVIATYSVGCDCVIVVVEVYAIVVAADIIACDGVVAAEMYAIVVAADIIACDDVVAGIPEEDTMPIVIAGTIVSNGIVV